MFLLRKLSEKSLGLFLIIIFFAGLLTTIYVSSEHIFYWWDFAFYKEIAVNTSKMFVQNPFQALKTVYFSTWLDYNYYFALPLIPFMELFKYSRLGYIISLVFVYHIPMLIVAGSIARKILPASPYAGWVVLFTGVFIPELWVSIFRGYPDTGAVLLVAIAITIYLQDMELKKWRFQLPMIGVLSGLAIIFRRHFAYNVASLLFSIGVVLFLFNLQNSQKNWRKFLSGCLNILIRMQIILAFLVLSVVLLAPGLFLNIIYVNYLNLYSSYSLDTFQIFIYFLKAYGVLWFLAFFGFASGIPKIQKIFQPESEKTDQRSLFFILLFGMTSAIVWITVPRQTGAQYVLHVALPIILGISMLVTWLITKSKTNIKWLTICGISLVFGYNLWAGLAPAHLVPISTTLNFPPLYRTDYDEVARLVTYLRKINSGKGNIYVVDSSNFLMNSEILHNAEVSLYGESAFLEILYTPQVDSRDFYPLKPLLEADYVVVSTPFQYHLSEAKQKVVKFIFDVFTQQWKISKDFKKLPEEFHLYDGAVLSVYKRQAPTSLETTLLTFDQMRKYIGLLPGGQSNWMLITPSAEVTPLHDINGKKHSVAMANVPSLSFLYAGADPAQYRINGKVQFSGENCAPVNISMKVFSLSEPISVLYNKQIIAGSGEFILSIEKADNTALVLSFDQGTNLSTPLCEPILEWEISE